MLNLAPLRYSKVIQSLGGPIARMEHCHVDVFGQPSVHAVTYLKEGIVNSQYLDLRATDQPDGAGCHVSPQIACYMAISEAMERWAVHYCRARKDEGLGGIQIDGSSNGFAAFPGLFRRQARRAAFRESIERHCLICWWEGLLGHRPIDSPWPGVSAIAIDNPFSKHAVVVIWSDTVAGHSYAFSAGDNTTHASRRALIELSRTQSLLSNLLDVEEPLIAGERGDVFERRIRYFSKPEGAKQFNNRLKRDLSFSSLNTRIQFDGPVVGPWDTYASVWRTIIEAPNQEYLSDRDDYFFW